MPPAPTAKALARAKQMPTFVYYPEGYHMLLRDLQREEVYEDIFEWVTTQKMTSPNRVQAEHVSSGAWTEKHIGNTPVKRAALQQRTKQ